jgi:alanine racemase
MEALAEKRASELRPTWVEIDLGALARNFARVRDLVAPRRVWCVVKANAYGHGAVECSRRLRAAGADAFAVATVDEGIELRDAGITGRILVMAGIEPLEAAVAQAAAHEAAVHRLEVGVWRVDAARALGEAALLLGDEPARVHLKVDTGMGRLGVFAGDDLDEALRVAREIAATDGVRLEGMFSNLAAADVPADKPGHAHTAVQVERFERLCAALEEQDTLPPERHLCNSAAVLWHEQAWRPPWCNGVRPGLVLAGVAPPTGDATMGLEPVMSWHSVIAAVRHVPAGWPLGYGATRRAEDDCTIGVLPVGYHDGFPRALSDRAEALVGGRRAQVVGAISMDLTLVDITGIPAVREGDPVVLLGASPAASGAPIGALDIAAWSDSIAHEVLCRVGTRMPRRFVETAP